MSYISPGDFIRCIEHDQVPDNPNVAVHVGRVYVCEDVLPGDYFRQQGVTCTLHGPSCTRGGVRVREVGARLWFFCEGCFEPIYRPKFRWEDWARAKLPRFVTDEEPV